MRSRRTRVMLSMMAVCGGFILYQLIVKGILFQGLNRNKLSDSVILSATRASLKKTKIEDFIKSVDCDCDIESDQKDKFKKAKFHTAFPKQIIVSISPYLSYQQALKDEENINWHHDHEKAVAITAAYAATELKKHLEMIGIDIPIVASPVANLNIKSLILTTRLSDLTQRNKLNSALINQTKEALAILPSNGNVVLFGTNRVNLLYASYRLLENLGFAWYDPYEVQLPDHPEKVHNLNLQPIMESPKVRLRGYWMWAVDGFIPDEFAIWLARNRLNLAAGIRPALRHKLGIKEWGGGHDLITQAFANESLYKAHPDWYALIQGPHWYSFLKRSRRIADSMINPSFASKEAAEYFADKLIPRLAAGDLGEIDILNLWPTDSRSKDVWDQNAKATSLGNQTDNLLFFYLVIAEKIDEAYRNGILHRPVMIAGISYYVTWEPPTNLEIIRRLKNLNYVHLFYTNQRSWSGRISQNLETQEANNRIIDSLTKWKVVFDNTGIVEYHNYSVFSAVGVDDFEFAADNYEYLTENNTQLFAYMHPLLKNPGPRRLTNILFAQLGWEALSPKSNANSKAKNTRIRYFVDRYGKYASEWCKIYALMSRSTQNVKEMFAENSLDWLLLQKIYWDSPRYTQKEVVALIPRYIVGGVQSLPTFGDEDKGNERANFAGLRVSLLLQSFAKQKYHQLFEQATEEKIKHRMQDDIAWFDSTMSRYSLLKALSDYHIDSYDRKNNDGLEQHQRYIKKEVDNLTRSSVTADTISPVDQRAVFGNYLRFINSHGH